MKDLDFELIFRYYLDEVYAGKPAAGLSLLEIAWIRERIDNKMLALIMRQGLEEVLLCDLESEANRMATRSFRKKEKS